MKKKMKKKMISLLLLGVLLILLLPGAQSLAVAQPQDNESDIRVMSANLRAEFASWSSDGIAPEPTSTRVLRVATMLEENDPIIVGTQEMSPTWYTAFQQLDTEKWGWLEEPDVAGYSYYNFVPNKGLALNSILYRKDLLTLNSHGAEAYTQRSNGQCIVWGVFTLKSTGKQFVFISTHWTPGNDKANERLLQAEQLAQKVNELRDIYGDTVIVTGDFNCNDETQEFRRFLINSNSLDSRNNATVRGDSNNKIDHITATADGSFTYHTICYEANNAYDISDHPFALADVKLSTALLFNFTDTNDARMHYKQNAYRHNAFDYHTAFWTYDSGLVSNRTINKTEGVLSFNATSAGNPYIMIDTNGTTNPQIAYGLNFDPRGAEVAQIRFRLTDCQQISTSTSPSLALSVANTTTGKWVTDEATYSLEQAKAGEITVTIPLTQSGVCSLSKIETIRLTFQNIKNGTVKIDYIYVGKDRSKPIDEALFFDFCNTGEDQTRYNGGAYKGYQYDAGNWTTAGYGVTNDFTINNDTGTVDVAVKNTNVLGPIFATAHATGVYQWDANGACLDFNPANAQVFQIRFKLDNCQVVSGKPSRILVRYGGMYQGTYNGDNNENIIEYTVQNGKYLVLTLPLSETFRQAEKITQLGLRFQYIEGMTDGTITIDYIYVGPESGLPMQHIWSHKVTKPTCIAQGYTTHTCSRCSHSYKDTYTATVSHFYSYKATKNPTTSATGTLTGTCSVCSATTTKTLPKLNATDYTKTVTKAPTCTANGTDTYKWKTTTYGTFSFTATTTKLGHDYTYTATTKPTTSATGVLTGTCSRCTSKPTVELPKLNTTDYTKTVTKAPTCTADGTDTYKWKTTTYGTFSFTATTTKLGHDYTYTATTKPTTSATGVLTGTCSRCTSKPTVELPKLNTTDYTKTVTKAPTCTADGTDTYKWKTTTYGTFSFTATTTKLGHDYTYTATTKPTTSATGVLTGTCSRCTSKPTVELPKLNTTDYTKTVTKAPTCTADGTDTYKWKTTTYGTFSFTATTTKLGHDYTYTATTKPTTSATGVLTGTCSRCTSKPTVELPKLNTTDYTKTVTKAPTCTANGTDTYKWKTTTYGTFSFTATTTKLGHDYTYTATTKPTTSATGVLTGTCSRCTSKPTVELPKLNTTDYTKTVTKAPTCSADGTDTYKWKTTTYGTFSFTATTTKLGHDYTYTATTKPTTSATGVLTGTCSRCTSKPTVELPKLNTTDYTKTVTKAPTCTADGTDTYKWKTTTYGTFSFTATTTKLGHNYTTSVTAPTCTAQGYTTHTCSRCDDSYVDTYTDAVGHKYTLESVSGTQHKRTCSKCSVTDIVEHSFTYSSFGSHNKHQRDCACGYSDQTEGHKYSFKQYSSEQHTRTCSKCGFVDQANHIFTYTSEGVEQHKRFCNWCKYEDSADHTWDSGVTTSSATCTAPGIKTHTCTDCSQTKEEGITPTGHSYTTEVTAPTCTEQGYTTHSCSRCSDSFKDTYISAKGHTEVIDKAVAATCTETGLTEGKHCSVCNAVLVAQQTVPAKGHTEVVDKAVAATCTETGLTEGKHCSVCNAVLVAQQTVPAKGHTEVIDKAVEATCTETGLTEGKHCSVCNAVLVAQQTVPAKGHTEVVDKAVAATCTETGLTEGKHCSVCNAVLVAQQTVPAKGHTEVIDKAVEATCTETGLTEGKHCSVCNAVLVAQQTVPAKGHTEVIDKAVEATCTETGLTEGKHCSVCNAVLAAQQTVPAKGHTEVIDKAVAATCKETGLTEGKHCSVCDATLVAQETVPAKGHTEVIDKAVAATCTETGLTEGKHCSVCNAVLVAQQTVPAKGHTEVIDKAVAATCTETGLTEGKHCSVCNAVLVAQQTVPAKGHTEVIDKAVAATCTATGKTEGKHCSVCNAVLVAQQTVPAKGHTEVIDKAVAATCTETGLTEGKHCSVCNAVLVAQQTVPTKGHTEVIDKAVEATCTETGLTEGKHCSVCDATLVAQETVPAKGHTEVIDKAVAATCTATGKTEGKHCSVCNAVLVAQQTVPAKGHTEVIDKAVAATCTATGKTEGKHCSVCNAVLVAQQTVPAKGHTEVIDKAVEATCTETGLTEGKHCSVCDVTLVAQETVPAKGHTEVIDKAVAATCTETGLTEGKHCSVCNAVLVAQQTVPAKGHTEVIDKAVEATCTETGLTEGKHCSVCNAVLAAQQTVPAKGHTEVIDKAVAATCKETGLTEGKHCSVCDATLVAQETVPAKGHTEVIDKAVAATCTETGLTEGKHCSVCNAVLVAQQTVPAKGHTEVIDKAVEATCTETGLTEGKHCSVCNAVLAAQQTVPAKGHTEVIDKAVAETCTETGLTEGKHCSVCDATLVAQETVPAKGHTEVIDKAVAATCTATGKTEGKHCSVCNAVLVAQQTVPAKGHTEVIDKAVAATCTETGLTEGKHCSVCNAVLVAQQTVPAKGHTEVIDKAVAATCKETGLTEGKHCSVCNVTLVAQEIVSMKEHVDVHPKDNFCDSCDTQIEEVTMSFRTISLEGNIAVNFYMSLTEEVYRDENAYMQFTMENGRKIRIPAEKGTEKEYLGHIYYVFTCEVAAKEMTDTILGQFFYGENATEEYSYSVKAYGDSMLGKPIDESLRNLLHAMLNYGAASQIHFNYHTERLANDGLETPDYASVNIEGFPINKDQGTALVRFAGASLILNSETTLRIIMSSELALGSFTVTFNGKELPVKTANGLYYVDIENISAKDLDEFATVTVFDGQESAEISYSPMSYCASVRINANGIHVPTTQDCVAALYLYNQAANVYFAQ